MNVLIKDFLDNLCGSKTHSLNLLAHSFPRVWNNLQKWTYGTTSQFKINKSYTQGTYKSRHQMSSVKKSVLRNLAKFTGKHLCQSLFFNKHFFYRTPLVVASLHINTPPTHWLTRTFLKGSYKLVFLQKRY